MVQPLVIRLLYAVCAVAERELKPAFEPPPMPAVIPVAPLVSQETNMFSTDWAVRAQFVKVPENAFATNVPVTSNWLAVKPVIPVQLNHVD